MLEGILVFVMLVGVLLGAMLIGQWGTRLQYSQMGARLLAFNAGDVNLARFGRAGDSATQTFTSSAWDTVTGVDSLPTDWLNTMFSSLTDDRLSGRVKGTQQGRLADQGPSVVNFTTASVGYFSTSSAASNSWVDTTSDVGMSFLGITYWVGYNQTTPEGLNFIPTIPASNLPILDTVYARLGIQLN